MFNLRSWATPITIGSFVISAISGVILFFHLNIGLMKPAHEWLSWFMILGVAMHVFTNWRAFLLYFKKPIPLAVIGVFLLLTVLSFFSLGSGGEGKGGGTRQTAMKSMKLLQSAPITMIAQMAKSSPDALIERLKAKGITVENAGQTLAEIAKNNKRKPQDLLSIVTK